MAEVVVVSDTKAGLAPLLSCLDLLSVSYCQLNVTGLIRYIQQQTEPHWLLLKVSGQGLKHIADCNAINDLTTEQPLVLLVDSNPQAAESYALEQGFIGVLSLDMPLDQMLKALMTLKNGGLWYSRTALEQLVSKQLQQRRAQKLSDTLNTLTNKEKLIAKLSAEGLANGEIATHLHLSPNTVKTHMQRILRKTKVKNRTQLSALFKYY